MSLSSCSRLLLQSAIRFQPAFRSASGAKSAGKNKGLSLSSEGEPLAECIAGEGNGRKKSPPKDVSPQSDVLPPNRAAGDEYLVPEYFSHDINSYADLNMQMQKHRLPRPVKPSH